MILNIYFLMILIIVTGMKKNKSWLIQHQNSNLVAVTQVSDIALISSKEFFDIQVTIDSGSCRFTLNRVRDIIIKFQSNALYR